MNIKKNLEANYEKNIVKQDYNKNICINVINDKIEKGLSGNIKCTKGIFNTWNDISIDILKSSIQKYIRRGMLEKAYWCLIEFDILYQYFTQLKNIKSYELKSDIIKKINNIQNVDNLYINNFLNKSIRLQENLINRLKIICCEDISIGNIYMPVILDDLLQIVGSTNNMCIRMQTMMQIIKILTLSKKSREIDHIKIVYYDVLKTDNSSHFFNKYYNTYCFNKLNNKELFHKQFNITCLDNFKLEFDKNNDSCFYWFFQFIFSNNLSHKFTKHFTKHFINYIINNETDCQYLNIYHVLYKWFRNASSKDFWIFGCQIILLSLRKHLIPSILIDRSIHEACSDWESHYINSLNFSTISIDDYCIDLHTSQGRILGKNIIDFVTQGSVVLNESSFTNNTYKDIYVEYLLSVKK